MFSKLFKHKCFIIYSCYPLPWNMCSTRVYYYALHKLTLLHHLTCHTIKKALVLKTGYVPAKDGDTATTMGVLTASGMWCFWANLYVSKKWSTLLWSQADTPTINACIHIKLLTLTCNGLHSPHLVQWFMYIHVHQPSSYIRSLNIFNNDILHCTNKTHTVPWNW